VDCTILWSVQNWQEDQRAFQVLGETSPKKKKKKKTLQSMLVFWWVKSDAKMLSGVHVIIGDGGGLVQWRQLKLNHLSGPFPTFLSTIPTLTTLYALLFHLTYLTSPPIVVAFCIQWRSSSFKIKIKVHWLFCLLLFHLLKLADILNKESVMNSFFAKMNWLENALPRQQQ
jgi:hypothetical protein